MVNYVDTPIPTDDLDVSQPQIRNNFISANTTFGKDHYAFNNLTGNDGYHAVTHWPDQVSAPTSSASYSQMYGLQPTSNVGVLQFSLRGSASQVPSPVTYLQSIVTPIILAPNTTSNILDFTGMPNSYGVVFIANITTNAVTKIVPSYNFFWDGSNSAFFYPNSSVPLRITNSSNILQVLNGHPTNTYSNVYWTLQFYRIG